MVRDCSCSLVVGVADQPRLGNQYVPEVILPLGEEGREVIGGSPLKCVKKAESQAGPACNVICGLDPTATQAALGKKLCWTRLKYAGRGPGHSPDHSHCQSTTPSRPCSPAGAKQKRHLQSALLCILLQCHSSLRMRWISSQEW